MVKIMIDESIAEKAKEKHNEELFTEFFESKDYDYYGYDLYKKYTGKFAKIKNFFLAKKPITRVFVYSDYIRVINIKQIDLKAILSYLREFEKKYKIPIEVKTND